jgi:hypothetical protein
VTHEYYTRSMIKLRFPNLDSERKALGFLAGRFPFKTYSDGCTLVPESALARLALEGITFTVEGRAAYEHLVSQVRDTAAPAVL